MPPETDRDVSSSPLDECESVTIFAARDQSRPRDNEPSSGALAQSALSKTELETEKLKEEVSALRLGRRWTSSLRPVALGLIASLSTGAVGYLFGDSLKARSRAEMRKATMDRYFSVDNSTPGKRRQMLSFIERYLASDDPELLDWAKRETAVVDGHLLELKTTVERLEGELTSIRQQSEHAQVTLQETVLKLDAAEKDTRAAQSKRRQLEWERDYALRERDKLRDALQETANRIEKARGAASRSVSVGMDK